MMGTRKGIVGTHKEPPGLQTLSTNRGRSMESGILTIAGIYCPRTPDPALLCLPPAQLHFHEFICAHGLSVEVLSPNSIGSLSERCRGQKVSRTLPTFETRTMGITHGAATQNITSLSSHAAFVLAFCRSRFLFAPQHFCSVAASQEQGWQKRGGVFVMTHDPRHQASTSQKSILSMQSLKVELDQGEEPARSCLGFFFHHITFDHCLVDGLEPDQPRLQGNLLCRKDWLQLQEVARSEWAILPIQEVAAYPWCTACEHLRSGNCPEAHRAKWAHVGWKTMVSVCRQGRWPLYRMSGKHPRLTIRTRGVGTRRGWWVLEPPHSLQPTAHRSSRGSLCKSFRLSHGGPSMEVTCAKQQKSVHSGNHFASCSLEPLFARKIWTQEPAAAVLQCSQTLGSGRSGAEPPREEIASAGRPLDTQHAERDIILEAIAELADPGETVPTRWLGQEAPEDQLSPTEPVVWRSNTGQTAPPLRW